MEQTDSLLFGLPTWTSLPSEKITEEQQKIVDQENDAYQFRTENGNKTINNWFSTRHDYHKPLSNISFQSGELSALANVLEELTEDGANIIIRPPVYHAFVQTIKNVSKNVVNNPLLKSQNGYSIDFDHLEALFSNPENQAFILYHPQNPIGQVWNNEDLLKINELGQKHNTLVISNETHADIIYKGTFKSILQYPINEKAHVIVLNSIAKTFGIPTLSDRYLFSANKSLLKKIESRQQCLHLYGENISV